MKKMKKVFMFLLIALFSITLSYAAINSDFYKIDKDKKMISRISPETDVEAFKQKISVDKVYKSKSDTTEITSGLIGTGMVVIDGQDVYELSVAGDFDGDGKATQLELSKIIRHIVGLNGANLEGLQYESADLTGDGLVDQRDITKYIRYIVFGELDLGKPDNEPDTTAPTVALNTTEPTTSGVTAIADATDDESGIDANATYTFYIKEGNGEYIQKQNTASKTCEFTGLKQNTTYTIKVEVTDNAGNKGIKEKTIQTRKIPNANQEGSITVGEVIWEDGKPKITITTNTDYKIEHQENGTDEDKWEEATGNGKTVTITDLENGDTVNIRLTDGTNAGEYVTIEIVDAIKPNEFEISVTDITETGFKVTGSTTDGQTGVKDYTYVAEPTTGTPIKAEHVTDITYIFTALEEGKEYKVYMIAYDNAGNERKSNEVTITTGSTEEPSDIEKAKDDSMFDKEGNTELEDENGNLITIPEGFKVKDDPENGETVDEGIIIIDRDGNEFVWIPVGKIYTDKERTEANAKNIELNRYTFDTNGNPTAQNDAIINSYYQELETSSYGNTTARSITNFKRSVEDNKGYYIGRYEARTGTARSETSDPITPITEKATDSIYNYVTQKQAAELSRNMYDNTKPYTSDLINSYAWDTATLFLQTCGSNSTYSRQTSINDTLAITGTNSQENKDVECNVYDMAGNISEWTTETSNYSGAASETRGGECSKWYTSMRSYTTTNAAMITVGFRPIIYIEENKTPEIPDATKEGAITVSEVTWEDGKAKVTITTETDYKIEYQIDGTDENSWQQVTEDGKTTTIENLENGNIVYVRLTDGENAGQYATIQIIDAEKPNEFTIIVTDVTDEGCKVSGSTTDGQTGIKDYTYVAEPTTGNPIKAEHVTDTTYTFTTLASETEYKVYMIAYDNAGNDRMSGEVTIKTTESKSEFEKAQDDSMFDKTENTKIEDKNGNSITIPAGFKIKDDENADTVDKGIVIIDRDENEFVWIPVGTEEDPIKTDTGTKIIELNRYTFNGDGNPTAQNSSTIRSYYYEVASSSKGNATAKSITGFRQSVEENKGYYIGRYEARKNESGAITEKGTDSLYNGIGQPNAATVARNMYDNTKPFVSDLMNSYAWDTATLFLQSCGTNSKYSIQTTINTTLATTGTNNQEEKDVQCNVYDMSSNVQEWTTETCSFITANNVVVPCVSRGGHCTLSTAYTNTRSYATATPTFTSNGIGVGFRPIIYIK